MIKIFLVELGISVLLITAGPLPAAGEAPAGAGPMEKPKLAEDEPMNNAIEQWIATEAIPFSLQASEDFHSAVDRLAAGLGDRVELLGIGEPLHGGEEFLQLRNRLFGRLAEKHDFRAIAVESCFLRGRLVDGYVGGTGTADFADVGESGFSHRFGALEANRELVEWMREWNADPARTGRLRFYGFDAPMEMTGADSPRFPLELALDRLAPLDPDLVQKYRKRLEPLYGDDADWLNPAAVFDPDKSIGRSPRADDLRIAVEDLLGELEIRRPGLLAGGFGEEYALSVRYVRIARQLLNYHAAVADKSDDRNSRLIGIRDAMMADNLAWIVEQERERGKVLVFAHNSHLKRGEATMQLGSAAFRWWPAGAHLDGLLGPRYAAIGAALGSSGPNGILPPEPGSLEARLGAQTEAGLFIPTHRGRELPPEEVESLPVRSVSKRNPGYFPLTPASLADFDWLAFLDSVNYTRGAPPLPDPQAVSPPPDS